MLQKIVLAIAVFLVILVALTFGEGVIAQLYAWLSHLTGLVLYNFSDIAIAIKNYVQTHASKVILAVILTVPVCLWLWRRPEGDLKNPGVNRKMAIVLALCLGWLGAHRFYLGQIGWGFTYLIVFYLIPPLAILAGLIDTVRYLFMNEADFPGARSL